MMTFLAGAHFLVFGDDLRYPVQDTTQIVPLPGTISAEKKGSGPGLDLLGRIDDDEDSGKQSNYHE